VGAELFHADRRTDVINLIVAFRNFLNAPKKQKEKRQRTGKLGEEPKKTEGTRENKDCLLRNKRAFSQLKHVEESNTGIGKTNEAIPGCG